MAFSFPPNYPHWNEWQFLSNFGVKAGVNMNLREILGSLKRDRKGKKGYGTPPDNCPTPKWHPRLLGNSLVSIYQFLT